MFLDEERDPFSFKMHRSSAPEMADATYPSNAGKIDHNIKLILIGDAGSGKSCILHRFVSGEFKRKSHHTVGVEFGKKLMEVGGKTLDLAIWDTAGQEKYRSVTKNYYRESVGGLLVYDITNRDSYNQLKYWLSEAQRLAIPHCAFIVIGNKADLVKQREVIHSCSRNSFADSLPSSPLF